MTNGLRRLELKNKGGLMVTPETAVAIVEIPPSDLKQRLTVVARKTAPALC